MATRKRPAQPAPPVGEGGEPLEVLMPDPGAASLDALLADLEGAGNTVVTVYRVRKNERGGAPALVYVRKYPIDNFSLDTLRDDLKGGEFRLYIHQNGAFLKTVQLNVEAPEVAPAPPSFSGTGLEQLAAAMREGFAQQSQLLREAMRPAQPAVDMPALVTAVGTMIQAMRTAVPSPAPVALPSPAPSVLENFDKMLGLFQRGLEIGRESATPDEGGMMGMMREVIRTFGPAAVEAVRTGQGAAVQLPPGATVPPLAAPAAQPQPAPVAAANGAAQPQPEKDMRAFYLGQLVKKAAADADPSLYAAWILDNVPADVVEQFTGRADWFEELERAQPQVTQYRSWFEELHGELVQQLAEIRADLTAQQGGGIPAGDASGSPAPDATG